MQSGTNNPYSVEHFVNGVDLFLNFTPMKGASTGAEALEQSGKIIAKEVMETAGSKALTIRNVDSFIFPKGTTPVTLNPLLEGAAFQSGKKLNAHYNKHVVKQMEFGPISKEAYVQGAKNLANSTPDGKNIFAKLRQSDGVLVIYKQSTNEFLSIELNGTIRTYFKPTDGLEFYNKQN